MIIKFHPKTPHQNVMVKVFFKTFLQAFLQAKFRLVGKLSEIKGRVQ